MVRETLGWPPMHSGHRRGHRPFQPPGLRAAIGFELGQRSTCDIDIFLQRGRLKQFLPSNNAAPKAISDRAQWPGHHLKFELDEGEIVFLTAPLHTEPGFTTKQILGRSVAFETPEEVVVKKMRYRAATFTARDVFDLAVVHSRRPDLVRVLADEVPDKLPAVRERVRLHASRGVSALERQIAPTEFGGTILPAVFELADAAMAGALALRGRATIDRPRSLGKGPADMDDSAPCRSTTEVGRDDDPLLPTSPATERDQSHR